MTTENPAVHSASLHVLVLGRHQYLIDNVQHILQKAGFTCSGFLDRSEAEAFLRMNQIDLVLVGGGVEPHERQALIELVRSDFPNTKVVEHFGGPATIVSEIRAVLG